MLKLLRMQMVVPFGRLDERKRFRKLLPLEHLGPTYNDWRIAQRNLLHDLLICQLGLYGLYCMTHPSPFEPRAIHKSDEAQPVLVG